MLKLSLTFLVLFLSLLMSAQNSCPNFTSENILPVKVVVYIDLEECFSLIYKGKTINVEPSQRVTFYMQHENGIGKIKMSDGQDLEMKFAVANIAIANITYEIVKNEKKGTFDTKIRYNQSQLTPEAQQRQQEDLAESMATSQQNLANEQKARDEAWDAQISAQKQKHNDLQFESDKTAQGSNEVNQSVINSEMNVEVEQPKLSTVAGEYPYQFKYNGIPIADKMMVADYRDTKNAMVSGQTDASGVVIFKSDLPHGAYAVDFRFNPTPNSEVSKLAYNVVLGESNGIPAVIDFKEYVDAMAEMMDISVSSMESMLGFDKLKN